MHEFAISAPNLPVTPSAEIFVEQLCKGIVQVVRAEKLVINK